MFRMSWLRTSRARAVREVDGPVRVRAVEVAVGVHHLRLHPETELHAQRVDVLDEALQPLRELLRVHEPVAQAGPVVVALAEPAVVHHEQLHADLGGLVGKLLLAGLVHVERGGFPGVVEHRAESRVRARRVGWLPLEAVQDARGAAEARPGEAGVEVRSVQGLAGLERVGEIESVEAAGHAHLPVGRLLDGHAPVAAPGQRAEPHAGPVSSVARRWRRWRTTG